jgi:hypothetical protein
MLCLTYQRIRVNLLPVLVHLFGGFMGQSHFIAFLFSLALFVIESCGIAVLIVWFIVRAAREIKAIIRSESEPQQPDKREKVSTGPGRP